MPQLERKKVQVGMPRRFSIGTMMILTTIFAGLFSLLRVLNTPPAGFAGVAIFVAGVTACQVLLFGGKNPRLASIVGGSAIYYVTMVVVCFIDFGAEEFADEFSFSVPEFLLDLCIGALWGYLVGSLIAAIFLVRKESDDSLPQTPDFDGMFAPSVPSDPWTHEGRD